jgi:hypothetical protein
MATKNHLAPKITSPKVFIDPSKVPFELLEMLQPGKIRTADDLTDFAGMVLRAMLAGDIPPQWSKILRDWAGLMFTNIASKGALASGGGVNFNLLQVIQNAERPQTQRQVVDAQSVVVNVPKPPIGPEAPMLIELDFSESDD